eukprot:TRINITY_DN6352_c0_g1_i1.p1 TRINITY_DN6352_c0_g1~~TRINITY_DN6352_c0_g1_i1.p1  ORF type:complete len:245 (-),score=57.71 TRINITY_DN6352_c0_g1_i1:3-737(-)
MSKVRSIPIITKTTCDQHYGDFSNCGSGAFSIVLTAVRTSNNQRVAIKVINTASLTDNEQERLKREIQVNQMVVHPNIVQVYEIYQGAEDCCLVMEYMEGGDLFSRVVGPSDDVDEEEARRVTKMILEAVEYLHNHNIAHRDLKPENVVFDKKGDTSTAKLIDFGFAKILDNQNSVLQTPVGTLEYCGKNRRKEKRRIQKEKNKGGGEKKNGKKKGYGDAKEKKKNIITDLQAPEVSVPPTAFS